jgi:hypothetical protein
MRRGAGEVRWAKWVKVHKLIQRLCLYFLGFHETFVDDVPSLSLQNHNLESGRVEYGFGQGACCESARVEEVRSETRD